MSDCRAQHDGEGRLSFERRYPKDRIRVSRKTSADDTRRVKRTTSGTAETKSWHCNLEDRPKIQMHETNSKAVA